MEVRIRRVGYVPVRHRNTELGTGCDDSEGGGGIPGFVPDPLFDDSELLLPPGETHAFWLTVTPRETIGDGVHHIVVDLYIEEDQIIRHEHPVMVHPMTLERRSFSMTHWLYLDALIDWYATDGFDAKFWAILPRYLQNMVAHGIDTLFTPIFTPPLDGVKRPTQLVEITEYENGRYRFGWDRVRQYVESGRAAGFKAFEWSHLFTQWGARYAPRVYRGHGEAEELLWPAETAGDSPVYDGFLQQFLPAFHEFLAAENLLENSLFHLSDEPHGDEAFERYQRVLTTVRTIAPWMYPIMDAVSSYTPALKGLMDIPVPSVSSALEFPNEEFSELWFYYSCIPRGGFINRFVDTPLAKIAMHGMLFYRWRFEGFLHWGYNYWYKRATRQLIDPFQVLDAEAWPYWAYGDPFVVYPGPDGPIDSIRWEVFSESLQDYSLLQTLGIDREDEQLQAIRSFDEFPKDAEWRLELRRVLFRRFRGPVPGSDN